MIYAASKSGLETYFESCRHWLSKVGGGNVQFYRLGIIDTSMSQDSSPFPKMSPQKAASIIVKRLNMVQTQSIFHLIGFL